MNKLNNMNNSNYDNNNNSNTKKFRIKAQPEDISSPKFSHQIEKSLERHFFRIYTVTTSTRKTQSAQLFFVELKLR